MRLLFAVLSGLRNVGLMTGFGHSPHKRGCACRSRRLARQDATEHHVVAINGACGVVVLFNYCALQRQAREYAFRARVSEYFSIHQDVSSSGGVTAHWARCH